MTRHELRYTLWWLWICYKWWPCSCSIFSLRDFGSSVFSFLFLDICYLPARKALDSSPGLGIGLGVCFAHVHFEWFPGLCYLLPLQSFMLKTSTYLSFVSQEHILYSYDSRFSSWMAHKRGISSYQGYQISKNCYFSRTIAIWSEIRSYNSHLGCLDKNLTAFQQLFDNKWAPEQSAFLIFHQLTAIHLPRADQEQKGHTTVRRICTKLPSMYWNSQSCCWVCLLEYQTGRINGSWTPLHTGDMQKNHT